MASIDDIQQAIDDGDKPRIPEDFGSDATPTKGMVLEGRHGAGMYQEFDQELMRQRQEERMAARHKAKLERIQAAEDIMTESVIKAAKLRQSTVDHANRMMDRVAASPMNEVALTQEEVATVKMAQADAKVIEERTMGKVSAAEGTGNTQVNIVAMFGGLDV